MKSSSPPRSALQPRPGQRCLCTLVVRRAAVAVFAGSLMAPALGAQTRAVKQHMVEGTVLDEANKPVPNAVVYLENVNSLNVYSYLSDPKGYYHFDHVIPQTDYEVWAFKDGIESKHQWISKFSSHKKFEFTLELNPKPKKFLGIF